MSQSSGASPILSELLRYLAAEQRDYDRIPTLADLSRSLGISISCLREQLEVARSLGVVEVKPKTGIRKLPYTFRSTLQQSLAYAMEIDDNTFEAFSDLRAKIESAYWYQAVSTLKADDTSALMDLISQAEEKISRFPPQIPHKEHREFHLLIYSRLDNPFVKGILESYWDLYETNDYHVIMDRAYLELVWRYHRQMAEAIRAGDYDKGFSLMQDHLKLILQRVKPNGSQRFE